MLSEEDVSSLIKEEAENVSRGNDSVSMMRHQALLHVLDIVQKNGFPTDHDERLDVSLVPCVFQEAIHDDIDWASRLAPLQQLSRMFLIDIAVQTGGRERHELSDGEYEEYVKASTAAINRRV